jgi:ubiquinone biosynthesis protein
VPVAASSPLHRLNPSDFLPDRLADYRLPLAESFRFFVDALPVARRNQLIVEQDGLPAGTPQAVRFFHVLRDCPTLMKLAQVVARHRDLPLELRAQLSRLETLPAMTAWDGIAAQLRTELGSGRMSNLRFEEHPLAEGSVAVVVPFTSAADDSDLPRHGVFKLLKPGVENRLDEELAIWSELGGFLNERCRRYGLMELDYRDLFDTVADLLRHEVDFRGEQRNLNRAADLYADLMDVRVPTVFPSLCTERVTAMERVSGRRVTDFADRPAQARRLAELAAEALLVRPFQDVSDESVFHADPHAGNLFAEEGPTLSVLDWSLTATLSHAAREQLASILLGALTFDAGRIGRAIQLLSAAPIDAPRLQRMIDRRLQRLLVRVLPNASWLTSLLDEAVASGAKFSSDLLLLRKSVVTIEGVVRDLAGTGVLDAVLTDLFARLVATESLHRPFVSPFSRHLGSHLSNADLLGAAALTPQALTRRWLAWCSTWAGTR